MKIMYRRSTPSGYSKRAARSAAKKVLLGFIADAIVDCAVCGYEGTSLIDAERFWEKVKDWPGEWPYGMKSEMHAAAMELLDELRRRSER